MPISIRKQIESWVMTDSESLDADKETKRFISCQALYGVVLSYGTVKPLIEQAIREVELRFRLNNSDI